MGRGASSPPTWALLPPHPLPDLAGAFVSLCPSGVKGEPRVGWRMVPQDGTHGFRKTLLLTPQDYTGLALGSASHRSTGTHTPTHCW